MNTKCEIGGKNKRVASCQSIHCNHAFLAGNRVTRWLIERIRDVRRERTSRGLVRRELLMSPSGRAAVSSVKGSAMNAMIIRCKDTGDKNDGESRSTRDVILAVSVIPVIIKETTRSPLPLGNSEALRWFTPAR